MEEPESWMEIVYKLQEVQCCLSSANDEYAL